MKRKQEKRTYSLRKVVKRPDDLSAELLEAISAQNKHANELDLKPLLNKLRKVTITIFSRAGYPANGPARDRRLDKELSDALKWADSGFLKIVDAALGLRSLKDLEVALKRKDAKSAVAHAMVAGSFLAIAQLRDYEGMVQARIEKERDDGRRGAKKRAEEKSICLAQLRRDADTIRVRLKNERPTSTISNTQVARALVASPEWKKASLNPNSVRRWIAAR